MIRQCNECIYFYKLKCKTGEEKYCCDFSLHCSDVSQPCVAEVDSNEFACDMFIEDKNKVLDKLIDKMADFLKGEDEEIPLDYYDIELLYKTLKKGRG